MMNVEKIQAEILGTKENWLFLFVVGISQYNEFLESLMDFLVNELKMSGVYVTLNKPYEDLIRLLDKEKISKDSVFFIDAVTEMVGGTAVEGKKCKYLGSPADLTGLGIAVTEAINALSGKEKIFVIIDSLSSLLIYNSPESVVRFSHFLVSKLRVSNISAAIIASSDIDKHTLTSVSQFCDKTIEVDKMK